MKSEARKVNEVLKAVVKAITHYEKTGNHKQVTFQYKANKRTPFEFAGWKHEHQVDSPRMILPEEIYVSESGKMLVRGVENRYNLKQFQNQFDNHPRSYRVDRMII